MDVMRKIRDIKEARTESSLPDLDVDPEEWLNSGELENGGGYRKDRKGWSWWLPEKELAMYEMVNNDPDYAEDKAFWEWFDDFRVERGLRTSRTAAWTYAPGVKKSYDSDSYFKSMWTGFGFGSKSVYGSAKSTELATALGFVQTLIQAVRSKPGRYKVEFATEDTRDRPTSYTDFENQQIMISPQAALDEKISTDKRIRITTGWALHESAHTEDTVDRWPVLFRPTLLKPPQIGSLLLNIVEDVRIEQRMGTRFPGFSDYFEDSRLYLWEIGGDKKDIGVMPDDLNKMLSFIVRTIRWPDKLEPELASDEAKEEFAWWSEWHSTYNTLDKNPAIRTHLEKALNRLSAMFRPEMEQKIAEGEAAEKAAGRAESAIKKAIEELIKKIKEDGTIPDPCSSPTGKDVLSKEVAKEVERKLGEEWEIEKKEDHAPDGSGISNYDLLVRRPILDDRVRFDEDKGPMARRLRSAFVLRPARPEYADRLLRQGQVDDDELWRWGVGDFRVFEQKIRDSAPDTDITLLVDESGSMGGSRMETARRLAQLMVSCLADMGGVNLKVRGHTGQCGDFMSGVVINRIWEPGDDQRRIGLLEADSQNMDGYAIDWCVKELQQGRGDTQKILIVIADGEPYAHGYSGRTAMGHVREVVNKAERNGVYVIQLGVGSSLQEAEQRQMFNHYIPYTDDENLLRDLTKLMTRLF
jgi:hypothetical protein